MIRRMKEGPEGCVCVCVCVCVCDQKPGNWVHSLCVTSCSQVILSCSPSCLELFMLYLFPKDGELLKDEFMSHPFLGPVLHMVMLHSCLW